MSPISATPPTAIFANDRLVDVVRTFPAPTWVMNPADKRQAQDGRDDFRSSARAKAPLITVVGGDVTHVPRLRAEKAVSRLTPFLPDSGRWTAKAHCLRAILPEQRFETENRRGRATWKFLGEDQARRLVLRLWLERQRSSAMPQARGTSAPASGPQ